MSSARRIAFRTRGGTHGPITRLMSPGDLGEILKPFVFLDLFDTDLHDPRSHMPIHPHSGLATITVIADGDLRFNDPAAGSGTIALGGFEWMRAGAGVWHGREMSAGASPRDKGFQLWIALGPDLEHEAVDSQYVEAHRAPISGPAHVTLGTCDGVHSPARSPGGITDLMPSLRAGSRWTFVPPKQQTVAWMAVATGELKGEANIERLRKLWPVAGDRRQPGGPIPVFKD